MVDGNIIYIVVGVLLGAFIGYMCKKSSNDDLEVRLELMKRDILIEQLKDEIKDLLGE